MNRAFQDHFSDVASRYADFRPHYPAALFDYLATLAPRDSRVWDCACGNGQATLDLAQRFDRVVATDASRNQIAAATPHPGVDYRVVPAEQSGLPDASVGLITIAQALHWFDLERFFGEATRVLEPGGVLAAWAYGISEVEDGEVNRRVQEFYGTVVGPYWPPERTLVEEGYRTLPFPFAEIAPPRFRMEARWTLEQLIGYCGTWSATDRCIKATGRNPLEALSAALSPVWGERGSTRRVVWPLALRVGGKPGGSGESNPGA
jgi:ubiquinone/menaquinone biosynthesis C-methylase UbiE